MAKSIIMSISRYDDGDERKRYAKELEDLSGALRRGEEPRYDEAELSRLLEEKKVLEQVPMRSVWGAVLRTFLPGVLFVVALFLLYVLLGG